MRDDHPGAPEAPGRGALIADVLAGISRLVQGEMALARAEAAERLSDLRRSVVQIAVAAILGITAINVLAGAAVAVAVLLGLPPLWATLLVGAVLLLLAFGFAQHAASLMRDAGKAPVRSADSVKRDLEVIQTMVRRDAVT